MTDTFFSHLPKSERTTRGGNLYSFDSLAQFCRTMVEINDKPIYGLHPNDSITDTPEHDWDYALGYDKAIEIMRKGAVWKEGVTELQRVKVEYPPMTLGAAVDEELALSRVGATVDVEEYLHNSPECMYALEEQPTIKPVVRLAFSVAAEASTPSEVFYNRGRAILGMVQYYEALGIPVEVYVHTTNYAKRTMRKRDKTISVETRIKLKGTHTRLNPANFAFVAAHPAFNRRVIWRWLETLPESIAAHNYGTTRGDVARSLQAEYDIYLPRLEGYEAHGYATPEQAQLTLIAHINNANRGIAA